MLKQRIITALVLALVFAAVILQDNSLWVAGLFALVLFFAVRELLGLTLKPAMLVSLLGSIGFVLLFCWSLTMPGEQLIFWQSLAGVVIWLLVTASLPFYRFSGHWPLLLKVLVLGLGLDMLWISGHALIYLHQQYGGWLLMYMLTLVWVADIGAYFTGRRFGRHKLAPGISPGKTWEGVIGGICTNLLWMLLIFYFGANWALSLPAFLLIGVSTSVISVVGDLFESILKREAGVKDSGKLLPGHGGVLDRIDSVIAASPVFLVGLLLAQQL